jgi:hypothetical protein
MAKIKSTVTSEEMVEQCIKMKQGNNRHFILDHDPVGFEITVLVARINVKRKQANLAGGVSILRNGRNIDVDCFSNDE